MSAKVQASASAGVEATVSDTACPPNNRERFLKAAACRAVDRPPLWLMRQAGRALPEYRALKEQHTFLELVQTPELAAEVTLQPIRRFDFDAAIIFSDILVIAEALGQPYRFSDAGGIQMEFTLKSAADIDRLDTRAVGERLQYVAQALALVKQSLDGRTALLGFAGSPWTLANFMLEGAGVPEYTRAKTLLETDPTLFSKLMDKLTRAVADFLRLQIDAGADAVQIFDSLGGLLPRGNFATGSARWMKQIITSLDSPTPVIVFSKGVHGNWEDLADTGARIIGVDWNVSLGRAAANLPSGIGVQGNLDPSFLLKAPELVAREAERVMVEVKDRAGHIFNLGHGVPPEARLDSIETLATTVRNFKSSHA